MIARTARQFPLVIALVVVLALAPIAFAGKGGGGGHKPPSGGGGSLSLVMVTDTGTPGTSWGDTVTWTFQQTATTQPYVDLTCSQNGNVVYASTGGFYAGYPWPWTTNMTLVSQAWTGGAASCTGRLYYLTGTGSVTLATTSFTAAA